MEYCKSIWLRNITAPESERRSSRNRWGRVETYKALTFGIGLALCCSGCTIPLREISSATNSSASGTPYAGSSAVSKFESDVRHDDGSCLPGPTVYYSNDTPDTVILTKTLQLNRATEIINCTQNQLNSSAKDQSCIAARDIGDDNVPMLLQHETDKPFLADSGHTDFSIMSSFIMQTKAEHSSYFGDQHYMYEATNVHERKSLYRSGFIERVAYVETPYMSGYYPASFQRINVPVNYDFDPNRAMKTILHVGVGLLLIIIVGMIIFITSYGGSR